MIKTSIKFLKIYLSEPFGMMSFPNGGFALRTLRRHLRRVKILVSIGRRSSAEILSCLQIVNN